ncbi:MAG: peptidylprolyl isomerase [Symbiobacteriaceae bacterium]|nr:peptidylprolyl isomerase [Symbiobacteriaceae bacterium]
MSLQTRRATASRVPVRKSSAGSSGLPPWMKWVGLLVAVALIVATGAFALSQKGLLAVVGGRRVTQDDLSKLLSYYYVNNPDMTLDDNTLNQLYYYLIVNTARMQFASEWGIAVTNQEVDEWYDEALPDLQLYMLLDEADHLEVEYNYFEILYGEDPEAEIAALEEALGTTGKQLFEATMSASGLTVSDFKAFVHQNLTLAALDKAINATIDIDESEAEDLYELNKGGKYSDIRSLSHILVKTIDDYYADLSDEEIAEAEELINEILRQLVEEEADFAELAELYSEDYGSAAYGGYLGQYTYGDMFGQNGFVYSFAVAAAELNEPGELSGVVKSEYGFHILRLDDIKEQSYESVRETIISDLVQSKAQIKHREMLEHIDVRPADLKDALVVNGW